MADQKVSELVELTSGALDPNADWLLVSDMSALTSKKMKPAEMIRASLPYLSTFWDFTTGVLSPTISFTRASTGWRYNSAGILVPETTDVARFDYDPVTLSPRGLLLEEGTTNISAYSEEFDNVSWAKSRSTVTPDTLTAPDGSSTMDSWIEDGTLGFHSLSKNYSFVAGTTYTQSVYAKANGRDFLALSFVSNVFGGIGTQTAVFNLANGTVHSVTSLVTAHIQAIGGGVYRCTVSCTATTSNVQPLTTNLSTDGTAISYTGDAVSGVYLWGYQLTASDFASSYIPTVASSVSRASDIALITNPQVLADRCWIVKARTPRKIEGGRGNNVFQVDDDTDTNRLLIYYSVTGRLVVSAVVANVTQAALDLGVVAADTDVVVACRFANNNFAASLNGGAIVTDTSGMSPTGLTTARVGRSKNGNYWNSTIKSIETRRTASDAELPLLAA